MASDYAEHLRRALWNYLAAAIRHVAHHYG